MTDKTIDRILLSLLILGGIFLALVLSYAIGDAATSEYKVISAKMVSLQYKPDTTRTSSGPHFDVNGNVGVTTVTTGTPEEYNVIVSNSNYVGSVKVTAEKWVNLTNNSVVNVRLKIGGISHRVLRAELLW